MIKKLVKTILENYILPHRDIDYPISPHTLMENGTLFYNQSQWYHEPFFGCSMIDTPALRNAFRLYTTVYYILSKGRCMGHASCEMSKYRAVRDLHEYVLFTEFGCKSGSDDRVEALSDLRLILFKNLLDKITV